MISSRTPEGERNRCPVCGQAVQIEPSRPFGDAPCPACGALLWFVAGDPGLRLFDPVAPGLAERLAEHLGISPEEVRASRPEELGIDSLDLAELLSEFEG